MYLKSNIQAHNINCFLLVCIPAQPADGDPGSGTRGGPGQVRRRRVPPRRPPSREGEEENLGQAVGGSSGR